MCVRVVILHCVGVFGESTWTIRIVAVVLHVNVDVITVRIDDVGVRYVEDSVWRMLFKVNIGERGATRAGW